MKKIFYSLLFFILLILSGTVLAQELLSIGPRYPVRLMSYNIRYDNPGDGKNAWSHRKENVFMVFRLYKPDIFCLQEALANQVSAIDVEFSNFSYYGVGRDDGLKHGEFCPIFYNSQRFALEKSGTFWLSENPDEPGSVGWDAALPRIATWIKLKDFSSGKVFYVFNTHFDHVGLFARAQSAHLVLDKILEIANEVPFILSGDFNDTPNTITYSYIVNNKKGLKISDSRRVAEYPGYGPDYTFAGFDSQAVPKKIIDYIFTSGGIHDSFNAVLTDNRNGKYPSDHLPVLVEIEIE